MGIKSEKFQRISGFGLAWEDTDRIGLAGSATAGACRAFFESFQAGKEKCCPFVGGIFFKIEAAQAWKVMMILSCGEFACFERAWCRVADERAACFFEKREGNGALLRDSDEESAVDFDVSVRRWKLAFRLAKQGARLVFEHEERERLFVRGADDARDA